MFLTLRRWKDAMLFPQPDPRVDELLEEQKRRLPTLWLLGKTGAGKSSIVRALTGDSRAEIGNGYAPCTPGASLYNHPQNHPVVRFLDTQGLGEAGYDARDDLAMCRKQSHMLMLVMRMDDAEQDELLQALSQLGNALKTLPMMIVYSVLGLAKDSVEAQNRERAAAYSRREIQALVGAEITAVEVDITESTLIDANAHVATEATGWPQLRAALIERVPELGDVLRSAPADGSEAILFERNRRTVLGYASSCALVDIMPGVGLVAVPSLQGKMLHALAGAYGLVWDWQFARRFLLVLGSGFLYRYGLSLGLRQLGKLIPVYGQTAGAAAASSISFASTYALGRAACLYCYRIKRDESIDTQELQNAFQRAFANRSENGAAVVEARRE